MGMAVATAIGITGTLPAFGSSCINRDDDEADWQFLLTPTLEGSIILVFCAVFSIIWRKKGLILSTVLKFRSDGYSGGHLARKPCLRERFRYLGLNWRGHLPPPER